MADKAIIIPPGGGQRAGRTEYLARSADTPRFNLGLLEIPPGMEVERHVHEDEDDAFYILEGELTFLLADGEEQVAGPGTFALLVPGVEHGFRNDSSAPVRVINVHAPAGFDVRMGIND